MSKYAEERIAEIKSSEDYLKAECKRKQNVKRYNSYTNKEMIKMVGKILLGASKAVNKLHST